MPASSSIAIYDHHILRLSLSLPLSSIFPSYFHRNVIPLRNIDYLSNFRWCGSVFGARSCHKPRGWGWLPSILETKSGRTRYLSWSESEYCTAWNSAVQRNTIQYNTIQCNTIQYNTIQYNTIQYNTIQYNTAQYNTVQYDTTQLYFIYLFLYCSSSGSINPTCIERTVEGRYLMDPSWNTAFQKNARTPHNRISYQNTCQMLGYHTIESHIKTLARC